MESDHAAREVADAADRFLSGEIDLLAFSMEFNRALGGLIQDAPLNGDHLDLHMALELWEVSFGANRVDAADAVKEIARRLKLAPVTPIASDGLTPTAMFCVRCGGRLMRRGRQLVCPDGAEYSDHARTELEAILAGTAAPAARQRGAHPKLEHVWFCPADAEPLRAVDGVLECGRCRRVIGGMLAWEIVEFSHHSAHLLTTATIPPANDARKRRSKLSWRRHT